MRRLILMVVSSLAIVVFGVLEIAHYSEVIDHFVPKWVDSMIDGKTALIVVIASVLVMVFVWAEHFIEKHKKASKPRLESTLTSSSAAATNEQSNIPTAHDPRIVVEFIDEREGQLFKKNELLLTNNGGSEALDVRIEDITLRAQEVCFPHVEGSINGNGGIARFEPVIAQYGPAIKPLFVTALMNEWNSYHDLRMEELLVPLTIRYTDFTRTFDYTTTCTLALQAIEEGLRSFTNSKRQTVIFRDFQHNKKTINRVYP